MKHRTGIGLDINDATICVVELRATAEGLQLVRSASAPTPPGSVLDGAIAQPKTVAMAVRRLLRSGRLSVAGKRVAVSLAGAAAVTRVTQLSGGGPSAIKEHLQLEIRRYAFFGEDAAVSDFAVVSSAPGREEDRRALLAAAREETVNTLVTTVMRAGIEPVAIDVSSLASARAVCSKFPAPPAAIALAVVEPGLVHLMVVQGRAVQFTHTAPGGFDPFAEATSSVGQLAGSVRSVLDFYDAEMGNLKDVQKILLCIGQDPPEDPTARLSEALNGVPVEACSPSTIVQDAGLLDDERLSRPTPCAIGLAMRAMGDAGFPVSLNLLPDATVQIQRAKKRALMTAVLAASLLLLAILSGVPMRLRLRELENGIRRVQESLSRVPSFSSSQETKGEIAALSKELNERDAFLSPACGAISWPALLSDIKARIPKDVRLTSLAADRSGGLVIEGQALCPASVHRFAALLADSELLRSAEVAYVRASGTREDAPVRHKIDCQLRPRDDKGK